MRHDSSIWDMIHSWSLTVSSLALHSCDVNNSYETWLIRTTIQMRQNSFIWDMTRPHDDSYETELILMRHDSSTRRFICIHWRHGSLSFDRQCFLWGFQMTILSFWNHIPLTACLDCRHSPDTTGHILFWESMLFNNHFQSLVSHVFLWTFWNCHHSHRLTLWNCVNPTAPLVTLRKSVVLEWLVGVSGLPNCSQNCRHARISRLSHTYIVADVKVVKSGLWVSKKKNRYVRVSRHSHAWNVANVNVMESGCWVQKHNNLQTCKNVTSLSHAWIVANVNVMRSYFGS